MRIKEQKHSTIQHIYVLLRNVLKTYKQVAGKFDRLYKLAI